VIGPRNFEFRWEREIAEINADVSDRMKLRAIFFVLVLGAAGSLCSIRLTHDLMSRVLLVSFAALSLLPIAMIYRLRLRFWLRRKRGLCATCGQRLDASVFTCAECDENFRVPEHDPNSISN
jgi:hypothetical protein